MTTALLEATTMTVALTRSVAQAVNRAAHPLVGAPEDFDPLIDRVGEAHFVLIGEASHGTHEFYRIRAEITKRLILTRGFTAVAVEGDWPDAYRVNRYVRGFGADADASVALEGFKRFPQWMWRNADVLDFVGWLREHNDGLAAKERAGFYGLDLYSLHASLESVVRYLRVVDPAAAQRAVTRYGCFDRFGDDPQAYGYATTLGLSQSCETEVVAQLVELRRAAAEYARRDGRVAEDDLFAAEQNARVVANAERYYRAMFGSRVSSWNVRDQHMAETLGTLGQFLGRSGKPAKIVVWAHNSHIGDARATEMGAGGELNVGQLARQRHGNDAVLVGFSTYSGTVTAASDWDEPAQRKIVRPALPRSYESLFHEAGPGNFLLDVGAQNEATTELGHSRLQRAIGVIYRPETERQSHYYHATLPRQFDIVLHYDTTRAVEPLERTGEWELGELPETYPTAL
jgi:erythromycin esterase-like protein